MWAQEQGRDCPSVLGTVRLCPVLSPHSKGDIEGLEPVQGWEQLEKKRLGGTSLCTIPSQEGTAGSGCQALLPGNNRTRGKGLRMCQERFRMDTRRNFFFLWKGWSGIGRPREVVESPWNNWTLLWWGLVTGWTQWSWRAFPVSRILE